MSENVPLISIDPHSEVPIFQQIHDRILEAIATGQIRHGDRLEPVRTVALEFGINPATAKKAYDLLRADGIVRTSPREGTVVFLPETATNEDRELAANELNRLLSRIYVQGVSTADIHQLAGEILAKFAPLQPSAQRTTAQGQAVQNPKENS